MSSICFGKESLGFDRILGLQNGPHSQSIGLTGHEKSSTSLLAAILYIDYPAYRTSFGVAEGIRNTVNGRLSKFFKQYCLFASGLCLVPRLLRCLHTSQLSCKRSR